ncbi:MAG: hypothetical protein Q7R33_02790 [Nitrosarchaeum sp.]|nr:hypothetical protein [Nitrosarchaeum sp.]
MDIASLSKYACFGDGSMWAVKDCDDDNVQRYIKLEDVVELINNKQSDFNLENLSRGSCLWFLSMLPNDIKPLLPKEIFLVLYDRDPMIIYVAHGHESVFNDKFNCEFLVSYKYGTFKITQNYL